jgi:hypothetical protein
MADKANSDVTCIESAYQDAIKGLFKQLFANLAGADGTESDARFVHAFTRGLGTLKRAKKLALGVVDAPAPRASAAMGARRRRNA